MGASCMWSSLVPFTLLPLSICYYVYHQLSFILFKLFSSFLKPQEAPKVTEWWKPGGAGAGGPGGPEWGKPGGPGAGGPGGPGGPGGMPEEAEVMARRQPGVYAAGRGSMPGMPIFFDALHFVFLHICIIFGKNYQHSCSSLEKVLRNSPPRLHYNQADLVQNRHFHILFHTLCSCLSNSFR